MGGLYGLAIGGLFAGESMFHRAHDASKGALVGLVDLVFADGDPRRIIDVQWVTATPGELGAIAIPRSDYLGRLGLSLSLPAPAALLRLRTDHDDEPQVGAAGARAPAPASWSPTGRTPR